MKKGTLIYDQDCPLCVWYTNQFIKFGILQEDERLPYFQAIQNSSLKFDQEVAQNKIAFVKAENNEAVYGIDSLLAVLGSRWKMIEIIGNLPGINSLLKLLYLLIYICPIFIKFELLRHITIGLFLPGSLNYGLLNVVQVFTRMFKH